MMRLCVLAAIAVSLVAAQTPRSAGCTNATGVNGLFENTTTPCAQQTQCTTAYTTCISQGGNTVNCTLAQGCIAARMACLFAASDNTTGCTGLNQVKLSLLTVASGKATFNNTDAFNSCKATACKWLNSTFSGAGTNCTLDYGKLCGSPIVVVATLLFQGNFTAILADPVKRKAFADAIAKDIAKALGVDVVVIRRMFIAGSRRQATQTLVVEVEVPGVSASNAAFAAAFAALAANPAAFLTSASAVYTSLTGQTLTILKIGTGTSSAAFSKIPVPTTARPATSAPTTARPTTNSNTTARPATHAPGTSGSVMASAIAAIVVAATALLF
jgi:hypothetical protein